ncbi:MAG TPA: methylated-DNA--[protein]-cysteine S-methyltransferase [Candidatus Limnocylindrales bacterium]|nr:methylated-DNA--[protein]-cysteine S-methyltransferase [Candidatus Limnocylindrales bacterium]
MTKIASTTMTTPIGPFTMIGGDDGMIAAGFVATVGELCRELRHPAGADAAVERRDLGGLSEAVVRYFAGDIHALDAIKVTQEGTRFQQAAWTVLRAIPAGETISYRELAARTHTRSARAAGSACGRNAVTLFVPCHRVVQSGGGLGGYYWGLERKRWLLEHERRHGRSTP